MSYPIKTSILILHMALILLFSSKQAFAQAPLSTWGKIQKTTDKVITSKAFNMTYVGVPLVVAGLIVKKEDNLFHGLRNSYLPNFRNHYDDYLQYTPAVAMLGLKLAGVKGRSSWPRMLVSDAFSVGIMAIAVNSIKSSAKVMRPDGSTNNSFPSGHTATAFMAATMLHKEYGLTCSHWYSIAGYGVATATAVSRMMNNRHWMSDVLAGAGIGILSTEVGYFLADLIFKDKGIRKRYIEFDESDLKNPPSFFGIYTGFSLMTNRFHLSPKVKLKASPGSTAGLEGAWFMNRYLGIGGRALVTSMPLSLTDPIPTTNSPNDVKSLTSNPLHFVSTYIGPYFSYPITDRFRVGTNLLIGGNFFSSNEVLPVYADMDGNVGTQQKEIAWTERSFQIGYSAGASVSYILKHNLSVRLFCDYNMIPSKFVSFAVSEQNETNRSETHKTLRALTFGASISTMIW